MRRVRHWHLVVLATCLVATAVRGEERPADVLPADAIVCAEAGHDAVQKAISMLALPPAAGMLNPQFLSPFAHANLTLDLAPGTAEACAPHLVGAGIAITVENPYQNTVMVLTFDGPEWPVAMAAGTDPVPDTTHVRGFDRRGMPVIAATGNHLLIGRNAQRLDDLAKGTAETLAKSEAFTQAAQSAGDAPFWAWFNMPRICDAVHAEPRRFNRGLWAAAEHILGLGDVESAIITGAVQEQTVSLRVRFLLEEDASGLLALLPETGADALRLVPDDAAGAVTLNWGDPRTFWTGIIDAFVETADALDDGPHFRTEVQKVEQALGRSLPEIAEMLGDSAVAYIQPRGEYGMIGRADWAVTIAMAKPYEFQRVLEKLFETEGMPLATQDRGGLPVTQWPREQVFYAFGEPGMVLAGTAQAVKARMDWLGQDDRATAKPVDPKAAAALTLSPTNILRSYPSTAAANPTLLDNPPAKRRELRLAESAMAILVSTHLYTLLGDNAAITVKRADRLVNIELKMDVDLGPHLPVVGLIAIQNLFVLKSTMRPRAQAAGVLEEVAPPPTTMPHERAEPRHTLPD